MPIVRHFVILVLAAPVVATPAAGEPAAPKIRITATSSTMIVDYLLKRPVNSLSLSAVDKPATRAGWTITPVGMALSGTVLRRIDGGSFDRATVTIVPDKARIDRAYPQAMRVGEGWLIHGPYLVPETGRTRVRFRLPAGWIVTPRHALDGHFYVGPRRYLRQGVVSPPVIPDGLRSTVTQAVNRAALTYERRFALTAPKPPLVIISADPTLMWGWRGDSTSGALSLRFADAAVRQPPVAGAIGRFVAHEVFHDWWKGVISPLANDRGAWVEEGMAEYAALLTSDDDAAIRTELAKHLNGCSDRLAPDGLIDAPPTGGDAVYDCGVAFQWLRDLQRRAASGGREDAFTAWHDMLGRYRKTRIPIPWREAIIASASTGTADAGALLLAPATERWPRLIAAMNGLGARIVPTHDDRDLRIAVVKHLLSQVCHDRMGFYTQVKSLKLDTDDHCGPLNGDPVIDTVAGHDLFDDAQGAFAAVRTLCAAAKPVVLADGGRPIATMTCTKPIKPPADHWSVEAWHTAAS